MASDRSGANPLTHQSAFPVSGCKNTKNYQYNSEVIKVVESMARVNGQSVLAIDFDRHEVVYRTENLLYMDEASINDVRRECSNPYWSIITDETLRKLLAIRSNYLLAGEGMSMDDYSGHVCTIDYPITVRWERFIYCAEVHAAEDAK